MKQSFWGYAILVLGIIAITLIWLFTQTTNIDQHNYNLLKETVESAMIDSIDISAYRTDGTIKIIEEKFVENFTRRFAENADLSKNYVIDIYDVNEMPPKVSLTVKTYSSTNVKYTKNETFAISNNIDAILESRWADDSLISSGVMYSNGGDCKSTFLDQGTEVSSLCVPKDESNRVFVGWYYDSSFTKPVGLPFTINGTVVIYGKWVNYSNWITTRNTSCKKENGCYEQTRISHVEKNQKVYHFYRYVDGPLQKNKPANCMYPKKETVKDYKTVYYYWRYTDKSGKKQNYENSYTENDKKVSLDYYNEVYTETKASPTKNYGMYCRYAIGNQRLTASKNNTSSVDIRFNPNNYYSYCSGPKSEQVETGSHTEYRCRVKEYTTSSSATVEGWTFDRTETIKSASSTLTEYRYAYIK